MNSYIQLVCHSQNPLVEMDQNHWIWDLLRQHLADHGFETFEVVEGSFCAYALKEQQTLSPFSDHYIEIPLYDFVFQCTANEVPSKNWNELWEKEGFTPFVIDDQLLIRATYHTPPTVPYSREIIIDPEMSFGSGKHHTTMMMLRMILQEVGVGDRVADIGCGTGILGIAALKSGASFCTLVDVDPQCVANAQANLLLNGIDLTNQVVLHCSDVSGISSNESNLYNCLFANIHRNIILHDLPYYYMLLHSGGLLLISGFLEQDYDIIQEALTAHYFTLRKTEKSEEWVAILAQKE